MTPLLGHSALTLFALSLTSKSQCLISSRLCQVFILKYKKSLKIVFLSDTKYLAKCLNTVKYHHFTGVNNQHMSSHLDKVNDVFSIFF